jgi:aconitase A
MSASSQAAGKFEEYDKVRLAVREILATRRVKEGEDGKEEEADDNSNNNNNHPDEDQQTREKKSLIAAIRGTPIVVDDTTLSQANLQQGTEKFKMIAQLKQTLQNWEIDKDDDQNAEENNRDRQRGLRLIKKDGKWIRAPEELSPEDVARAPRLKLKNSAKRTKSIVIIVVVCITIACSDILLMRAKPI